MGENNSVQCLRCQHNMKSASCGACATTAIDKVKKLTQIAGITQNSDDIEVYKYACKVVYNDPSAMKEVNPMACKFFLSNLFKIR